MAAAEMLRGKRGDGLALATKSTQTDLVTDLDRASDALIRALLLQARPTTDW